FTSLPHLVRLLEGLPTAEESTVEANPETVTRELARALRDAGVTRISLGAQTSRPQLLTVLERVAGPDDVRRAVHHLRDAGFDNISLDLIYGIPGQSASDLEADLADASRSSRSTCPATSSRRSQGRGSRMPGETSSAGRPTRW